MGNDASRPLDGGGAGMMLSPHAGGAPTAMPSPRAPMPGANGSAAVRRAKSLSVESMAATAPGVDRTIQRMDKTIRKRVRGGITYNMKIVLRGDRGTGKTALFHRLKGEPIPVTHEPTPQLQSATINWAYRANSEESVRCEVWDVVDRGFRPGHDDDDDGARRQGTEANPFELGSSSSAPTTPAAAASPLPPPTPTTGAVNGTHLMATVDATTVDVYHETHGVIFLLDVTKPHTLEYVRQQLEKVPVHIPTLVLGNFRDCGAQRKIFKEDIQELLYGREAVDYNGHHHHHHPHSSRTTAGPIRRPQELLYFECSLLNCYGLKALHQYFGIPFLQLKQQTIRQQLRIVEGEFAHLKHDLQAKIAEQRYGDYVEHIRVTGSDIRTGRRATPPVAATQRTTRATTMATPAVADAIGNNGDHSEDENEDLGNHRLERTQSSSSDIVVSAGTSAGSTNEDAAIKVAGLPAVALQQDLEDLPERSTSVVAQSGSQLKIDYTDAEREAQRAAPLPQVEKVEPALQLPKSEPKASRPESDEELVVTSQPKLDQKAPSSRKNMDTAAINLEDFQVPKQRNSDLDHFYSEDDSDPDDGDDSDVVVGLANGPPRGMSAKFRKQAFLESDSSGSEAEREDDVGRRAVSAPGKQRSPRRNVAKEPVPRQTPPRVGPDSETSRAAAPTLPVSPRPPQRPPSSPVGKPPASPKSFQRHSPPRRLMKEPPPTASLSDQEDPDAPMRSDGSDSASKNADIEEKRWIEQDHDDHAEQSQGAHVQVGKIAEPLLAQTPSSCAVEVVDLELDDTSGDHPDQAQHLEKVQDNETSNEDPAFVQGELDGFFSDEDEIEDGVGRSKTHQSLPSGSSDPVVHGDSSPPNHGHDLEREVESFSDAAGGVSFGHDYEPSKIDNSGEDDFVENSCRPAASEIAEQPVQDVSDEEDIKLSGDHHVEDDVPCLPRGRQQQSTASLVFQSKRPDVFISASDSYGDDEGSSDQARASRQPEELQVDEDDAMAEEDAATPAPAPAPPMSIGSISQSSPPLTSFTPPLGPIASETSKSALESFLNDSDGSEEDEDDVKATIALGRPGSSMSVGRNGESDDDEEDGDADLNARLAALETKPPRRRRSQRRQQREEFKMLSAQDGAGDSSVGDLDGPRTKDQEAASGLVNQDVLAAIRMAEQDAMRMLGTVAEDGSERPPTERSSSRRRGHNRSSEVKLAADDDGGDDGKKRSKKKKQSSKPRKSSSTSKRREMVHTDESDG